MSTSIAMERPGLGYQLKQAQHALRLHMDNALKPLGLTTPQYAVLSQLELNPGVSNATLARLSFVTAQTMHGIVANLEKRQLLKRKADPTHGRVLTTELTKQGQKMVNQAHVLIVDVEKVMTSSMNKRSRDMLAALLMECIQNLDVLEA